MQGGAQTASFLMTGKQSGAERDRIRHESENGNMLIVSTIGKEALDIPRLNRYAIAFPTRNATATKQMIGRVKRVHEAKGIPIVYDLYDHKVGRLTTMFQARRGVYANEGLKSPLKASPRLSLHQCVVEGCNSTGKLTRGMCSRHYQKWRKYGDPLASARRPYRKSKFDPFRPAR